MVRLSKLLCLLVSGGNSQIVLVKDHYTMEIIGQTIDDAAGEAFDKCAKIMGLPYPGGPWIDRLAKEGNAEAFQFAKPHIPEYNYSFAGNRGMMSLILRRNSCRSLVGYSPWGRRVGHD